MYFNHGAYNSGKHGNLREFVNSGKLRENSGNLKFTQGIYQIVSLGHWIVCIIVSNSSVNWLGDSDWRGSSQSPCCFSKIFCNSARKLAKWLLRWFVTSGFHFIIVWKRLFRGSGKLWEFHFAKCVSTLFNVVRVIVCVYCILLNHGASTALF